jgi:hypothetical protein
MADQRLARVLEPVLPPNLRIRPGVLADEPFVDHCQKAFRGHLGFMYSGTLARRLIRGDVLVAVDAAGSWCGYIMGTTSYDRNDAVSRIDQIAVVPSLQRQNTGGALLQAWIAGLPYGCTLICCWCAQDLKENRFWESQGFFPLAFRAGGQTTGRMHIFWERRVRTGDTTSPLWFPKETANGAMSAARLILPIPPGADWREVDLPRIVPKAQDDTQLLAGGPISARALAAKTPRRGLALPPGEGKRPITPGEFAAQQRAKARHLQPRGPITPAIAGRQADNPKVRELVEVREPKKRAKNLPDHVAAARELRDRFLEQVNAAGMIEQGKYDPSRQLDATPTAASQLAAAMMQGIMGRSENRAALPPAEQA